MATSPLAATVVTAILRCDFCAAKSLNLIYLGSSARADCTIAVLRQSTCVTLCAQMLEQKEQQALDWRVLDKAASPLSPWTLVHLAPRCLLSSKRLPLSPPALDVSNCERESNHGSRGSTLKTLSSLISEFEVFPTN